MTPEQFARAILILLMIGIVLGGIVYVVDRYFGRIG